MKPDGPEVVTAIFGAPCGQCIGDQSGRTSYESFADTLIRRLKERSGIKERYPIPKVGRYLDNDPDSIFLRTNPPPDAKDKEATRKWVGRLLAILQNPKREFLYQSVMEVLVPGSEPFRYDDDRMNGVLLDVLPRSEKASAPLVEPREKEEPELDESTLSNPKALQREEKTREKRRKEHWRRVSAFRNRKWELDSNARTAAEKLGLRHVVSAFSDVLRLSPDEAAAIVARHPDLRPKLMEYLQPQIFSEKPPAWPNNAIEMIWRADLRELAPWLEKWANTPPPGGQKDLETLARTARDAKTVLLVWGETDALTKTKLDIMLTGIIGGGSPIPEMLRAEFEALSMEEKSVIRNFVNWMRTIDVPWSRRYIENFFPPHTPRPDILYER